MEDILKRLLDAELKAEALVDEANRERERILNQALEESRVAEAHFESRLPELRAPFLQKAEERAQQAIGELKRRYEERHKQLRALAEEHEQEAIEAAVAFLTSAEQG